MSFRFFYVFSDYLNGLRYGPNDTRQGSRSRSRRRNTAIKIYYRERKCGDYMHFWRRLFRNNLKNRLFAAFVIMLLLSYTLLSIYNFQEVEKLMRNKISEQDRENLDSVKQSLENMMAVVTKTATLLEQDSTVTSTLQIPNQYDDWKRKEKSNTAEGTYFSASWTTYN
jgi:hypothetical protein